MDGENNLGSLLRPTFSDNYCPGNTKTEGSERTPVFDINFKSDLERNVEPEQIEAPDYLQSFNIDAGGDTVYDTGDMTSLATLPVESPAVVDGSSTSAQTTANLDNISMSQNPIIQSPVNYFLPMMRTKARGRGRIPAVPLDDVMEQKIRTFEGGDCVQQLNKLFKLFPRFKRGHVNRVFTRNMLNYEKSYAQLKEEDDRESEKCSKVRLVQSSKHQDKRDGKNKDRSSLSLTDQALAYMGMPLGRSAPQVSGSLYRRVIVTPEGSVEPAEEHEKKYLASAGLSNSLLNIHSNRMGRQPRTYLGTGLKLSPLTNAIPTSVHLTQLKNLDKMEQPSPSSVENENNKSSDDSTPHQTGNRFFRTNRICETELKKRGYLNRELRTATTSTPNTRLLNTTIAQSDAESSEDGTRKSGDAVKYMAKVGVVSNSPNRKKSSRRKDTSSKASSQVSTLNNESEPAAVVSEEPKSPDDGLKISNEDRKQLISFFNEAVLEELTLIPGCSRKTAQILASLRPFRNTAELVERLSNTRHLSPNWIHSCKDILEMRSTFVRLLQKCGRLTERVANHASRLLENTVSLPENSNEHSNTFLSSDHKSDDMDYSVERSNGGSTQLLNQQPAILNPLRELKPYQLVGLNWLRLLHHEQVNGILADEMGLGKTVQAIAFLASLWENGNRGPHLIICPSSTQDNWQRELALWCPHLKVLVYQGSAEQRKTIRLKIYEEEDQPTFNVLLTSYAVGTSSVEDRALMKRINFHYGIFDEAHMLKNMTSQRYRNLTNFRVQRRLLLTGTPLQNNLLELVSLLAFVMPEMFMRSTDLLKRMFQIYSKPVNIRENDQNDSKSTRSCFEEERLIQAKNLLQPFCLRRLKSQVLSQLPPKTSEVINVPMTNSQAKHYHDLVKRLRSLRVASDKSRNGQDVSKDLQNDDIVDENIAPDANSVNEAPTSKRRRLDLHTAVNGTSIEQTKVISNTSDSPANMVATLRKAANHQTLLSGIAYSDDDLRDIAESLHLDPSHSNANPDLIYEDLATLSDHQVHKLCQFYETLSTHVLLPESILNGSGKIQWLNENLPKLIAEGHRVLIFSQFVIMLDILEEFLRISNRRYIRLDGSTPVAERQELIDRFNSSSIEVFLLSTRAGGLGINLTGADTVIIHDIDFNPYNDRQAEDRCHRLGQKNPVRVIRLVSEGTVEEGMLRIATEKLRLEQNVTGVTNEEECLTELEEEENSCEDRQNNQKTRRRSKSTNKANASQMNPENNLESENILKILGAWNTDAVELTMHHNSSNRVSDQDVRSLLSDALKI